MSIVLDASALIAMLRDEPGGEDVARVIIGAQMSTVNFGEVVSHFAHHGMPLSEVDAMLNPLPFTLVDADVGLARSAGHLRATTAQAGLSLGDRFCLALALRTKCPAWTADRQWASIAERVGVDIVVIR